ncbi:MAG: GAF domain-containing protein [Chloroflexi bacterium]|nr:GAF domain-containing protein [Chloroflexota bacterium]
MAHPPPPSDSGMTPEVLVPRLGEYLLDKGLVQPQALNHALDYQKKKAADGHPRLLGRALIELGYIDRETLDQVITGQIFSLQTALKEANRQLETMLHQRTQDLEKRLAQIHAASQITQTTIVASSLDDLFARTTRLIVTQFHYEACAIYLLSAEGDALRLQASAALQGQPPYPPALETGAPALAWWVVEARQPSLIKQGEPHFHAFTADLLPESQARICAPIALDRRLLGVLDIQASNPAALDPDALMVLQTIAAHLATVIQNFHLLDASRSQLTIMEKRLSALETLDSISKVVAYETRLDSLFALVHTQIMRVLGEVDFLIALYLPDENKIEIPYAYEDHAPIQLPLLPLGQGLTSILIHSKEPLLLVEDTERRAEELGARVIGKPAKSWLGVPLLVAGEVIGAIIVQDVDHEHRFDVEDQRLLSNIASQVAVTVRNIRLLEEAAARAQRDRQLLEITGKIRAAADIQAVLDLTSGELSRALGHSVSIHVGGLQLAHDRPGESE